MKKKVVIAFVVSVLLVSFGLAPSLLSAATTETKLIASDGAPDDNFGYAVSISGDTIVVGAHADDDYGSQSGSAYVFQRNWGGGG